MIFSTPDQIKALTPKNPYDRLADGRPRVPEDWLKRMELVTNDEAYNIIERQHGYKYSFAGDWIRTQGERVAVGRAITCVMMPIRPDLNDVVQGWGDSKGLKGGQNNWVIDALQPGDLLVVDLDGKIRDGTFVGDNLSTAARARTGTGMVINGGIRDAVRIKELTDFPVFCKGIDPSAIAELTLVGVNVPVRIGPATVMPGDVVLATSSGVSFIPPHLVEEVVLYSEAIRQRDVFGKQRLAEGKYEAGQIDVPTWATHIEDDYKSWCAERGVEYKP